MEKRVMIRECVTRVGEHRKIPNKRAIGIYVDDYEKECSIEKTIDNRTLEFISKEVCSEVPTYTNECFPAKLTEGEKK